MDDEIAVSAAFIPELGAAENIEFGSLTISGPGPTDVLVAVQAVAVNPVDTYIRAGFVDTPVVLPHILGRDLVGEVIEAPETSGFEPGDRVWASTLGHEGRQGSFATQAVVPVDRLYHVPESVDLLNLVANSHPGTTAALSLIEHGGVRAGQSVFIGGAAGGVGSAGLAIAKWLGARVIATCSSKDQERVQAEGGDVVLDYRDPHLTQKVREAAPGGVDLAWDTSGHMSYETLAGLMGVGSKIMVTAAGRDSVAVPWGALYTRDVPVVGFVHSRASAEQMRRAAGVVSQGTGDGWLRPHITKVDGLSEARDAHLAMEANQVRGRIVLQTG